MFCNVSSAVFATCLEHCQLVVTPFVMCIGTGLGKHQQGMPQSLDPTANKGRAGLGLDSTGPGSSSAAASYALQPDSALLINDEPVLTMQEMEWWRIMEQRKPKKLLRSKFLPQDDVLLALRSAREQAQRSGPAESAIAAQGSSSSVVPDSHESNRVEPACLHEGPCLAPRDSEHSSGFWHMASLEAGLSLCSTASATQQLPNTPTDPKGFSFLDLSFSDSGAAQYLLNHAPVVVRSAVLMGSRAAEKLCSSQLEAAQQGTSKAVVQQWPGDFNAKLRTPSALADRSTTLHATPSSSTAVSAASLTDTTVATLSVDPKTPQGSEQNLQPCSTAGPSSSTEPAGTSPVSPLSQHSLASYQALTATVGQHNLVMGDLSSIADHSNRTRDAAHVVGSSAKDGARSETGAVAAQGDWQQAETVGVMEAEYSSAYRARLLWECAVALACLKPGELFDTISLL